MNKQSDDYLVQERKTSPNDDLREVSLLNGWCGERPPTPEELYALREEAEWERISKSTGYSVPVSGARCW